MNLKDLNTIGDFEKIIPIKKIVEDYAQTLFIDIKYDKCDESSDKNIIRPPEVFAKNIELSKPIDMDKIREDYLSKIVELSNLNASVDVESSKKFTYTEEDFKENKNINFTITNALNLVACDGRIGKATALIVSEKNYEKFNIDTEYIKQNGIQEIVFDDSIEDIIVYRKNNIDQPGLILLYNDEKYNFIDIGFYPHRQFCKITLPKNN